MRSTIAKRLDLILEDDTTTVSDDPYQNAMNIAADLDAARQRVSQLERDLVHATDRLCGGLAMGVRKAQPSLNVHLGNGSCQVAYRKKHLRFRPDLVKRIWVVDSNRPDFGNRFRRQFGHMVGLLNDLNPLAGAVNDFFTGHYKSIGRPLSGLGGAFVEGRQVTLSELRNLIENKDRLLRRARPQSW